VRPPRIFQPKGGGRASAHSLFAFGVCVALCSCQLCVGGGDDGGGGDAEKCHAFAAENAENGMNGIIWRVSKQRRRRARRHTISLACHNIAAA